MAQLVLKQEILDGIVDDPTLFGAIAKSLGVSVLYLPKLIKANDAKLTQASILKVIADHRGVTDDKELLQEVSEVSEPANNS